MSSIKITNMDNDNAMRFLLKSSSYCTIKLPEYIDFQPLLDYIHKNNKRKNLDNFCKKEDSPKYYNDVNYDIIIDKKGKYSSRKLTITNPIIYVAIVHEICKKENWQLIIDRFNEYKEIDNIKCCSIPCESDNLIMDKKEQILSWWNEYEQQTISQALNYEYMINTDIQNCYPSIYTHSIPWALHGKDVIKQSWISKKKDKLFGDKLDKRIETLSYGQTNGILQGSILFDLIAEIVLGYYDLELSKRLSKKNIKDYKILRYRDDYRIFSNNKKEIDEIYKELRDVLNENSLYLNEKKTFFTDNIISKSLKVDKVYGLLNPIDNNLNLQKKIFVIREIANKYNSSGLLVRLLHNYYNEDILNLKDRPTNGEQVISILSDIMVNNSRVAPECCAIIIKLFKFYQPLTRKRYINKIKNKVSHRMQKDFLNIWVQRLSMTENITIKYETPICQKLYSQNNIWNCSWSNIKIDESMIINKKKIKLMTKDVSQSEFDDFLDIDYF